MTEYLVEAYQPRLGVDERAVLVAQIRAEVDAMEAGGLRIRYLGPIFMAEDEICLHRFEASSEAAVQEASRRAGLKQTRIVEAVE